MDTPNTLGDYLRARRELVSPDVAGVPVIGIRRVPGLRREEVATLAGVSVDYYLRLEQGRDRNSSAEVLEALAGVLRLDAEATDYLLSLAGIPARPLRSESGTVPDSLRQLLAVLDLPAFVEDRYFDVLAANHVAAALNPNLAEGHNRLHDVFLDPAEQALYRDLDAACAGLVSYLRHALGSELDDARARGHALVDELSAASERFAALWARHDVLDHDGADFELLHPALGALALMRQRLALSGRDGLMLIIYHAEPDSACARVLTALAGELAGHAVRDP